MGILGRSKEKEIPRQEKFSNIDMLRFRVDKSIFYVFLVCFIS